MGSPPFGENPWETTAMAYNLIEDLNVGRDDWVLKVRVVRLLRVFTMQDDNDPIFLEMILLDEKDKPLHAAVRKNMITNFSKLLQEGNIYTITNLKISEANDTYRPIQGTIKGWFLTTTTCEIISDSSLKIPHHYFEFSSYQNILQRIGQKKILTDIIGKLQGQGQEEEVPFNGKMTKIRRLELNTQDNEKLNVTLWRNIINDYEKALKNCRDGSKTIAITSTIIRAFKDECSISSTSSTRIYINIQHPQFSAFKKGETAEIQEIKEIPKQEYANISPEKRMLQNRKSLQEIMMMKWESDDQEKVFTIQATINNIDDTFGWTYIGCEICKRKLKQEEDEYRCAVCKRSSKYPTPRFKLQLQVADDTAKATLTMLDTEAQRLLNTTAADLLAIHENNTYIPKQIQNLFSRTLVFEIKLTDYNLKEGSNNYTVSRTFIPKNIIPDEAFQKEIKKEPNSPEQLSSGEDTVVTTKKEPDFYTKSNNHKVETTNATPKLKRKLTKKAIRDTQDTTSSDEESLTIQGLREKATKKTKLKGIYENETSQSA